MIYRFFTRSIVWLLVSLLVFTILPPHMLAAENALVEQEQILIQVATDIEVFDVEGDKLGHLNQDAYLFTTSLSLDDNGKSTLQWGEKEAIIDNKALVEANVEGEPLDYSSLSDISKIGFILAEEESIPFYDESQNVIGSIATGNEFPVIKLDDSYFYILVGGNY